jgi:hypothetical protein
LEKVPTFFRRKVMRSRKWLIEILGWLAGRA